MTATDSTTAPIWETLRGVLDPELGENVVDLGIIKDVRLADQPEKRGQDVTDNDIQRIARRVECSPFVQNDLCLAHINHEVIAGTIWNCL